MANNSFVLELTFKNDILGILWYPLVKYLLD